MKTRIVLAALIAATPTLAAANDTERSADRYVADAMEIVTLPSGQVVTRLVSRSGITARQYWVESVYQNRDSLLVYGGRDGATQTARTVPREPVITARHEE